MATELLSPGRQSSLVQNTIYALPACHCILFTDGTTPTIQQSNTVLFTANVALTLTDGQAETGGGWIRCTSGAINITLKKV